MRAAVFRRLFDLPYVLLTLTFLFWSSNFIVARAVRAEVPPVGLAFWRWTVGLLIVLAFAWPHLRRDRAAIRRHWRIIVVLSATGIAAFNTMSYIGLQHTTAINGLLMQSTMPVVIVVMSYLFFRETVTPLQALGVALSLAGAVIIVARGELRALVAFTVNRGDLWIAVGVLFYSAYAALLRRRPPIHPLSFLAVSFAAGAAMLAPLYAWESASGDVVPLSLTSVLAIGYLAVFTSIIAYICFNRGVELVGANRAGPFFHLLPLFGSVQAVVFLGESFRLFHAFGLALILGGIVLATRRRTATPSPTPAV